VIGNGTHQDSALYRIIEKRCGYKTAHSLFHSFDKRNPTPRLEIIKSNNALQSKFPSILPILASIQKFKVISPKKSAGEMLWSITEHLKILKTSAKKYDLDDHYNS